MVDRRSTVAFLCIIFLLFHSTFEQSVPLRSQTERLALIQLRSSLGLRTREWPIKADPCSNWRGVECQNGRVVGINISGFKRTRIGRQNPQFAVDALANFTLLTSFNASQFSLPGSIPDWFGQRLVSLQVLDLWSCSISGTIPSSLGNLTNLTTLRLSHNRLAGLIPSSLGQLSGLAVLDLSHNLLSGPFPSSFGSLGNLTRLDMAANYLSATIPPDIGTLSKLQYLNLSGNSFSSAIPALLGNLSSLVELDLSINSLSGSVPSELRGLRNLQNLVIGNNSLVGSLPSNLFPVLTKLQFIDLSHNDFTGDLPGILWSMPELGFLDASGNNFTGTLPNFSVNANATKVVFNLSQNMFYGNLTSILGGFSSIDLSGNYFQGKVPNYARRNTTFLGRNCLQQVSRQRTVAECASFYSERGLTFDNFGFPNASQPSAPKPAKDNNNRRWIILAAVLGGLGLIAILAILIVCTRKRGVANQRGNGVGPVPTDGTPQVPGVPLNFSSLGEAFSYQQILQAAGDFNDVDLIKQGHSGDLFRGFLEGGIPVVIKRIDLRSFKKEAYMLELDFFSKVSHVRLVPFLGHCLDNENEKFLVYRYMTNGDLSSSLFRKTNSEDEGLQSLDWITRLKIAIGAAEALSYLHHECTPPLVHRDVQASSILLDDKYEVRLGSLSEICAQEGDTHQNMITRFLRLPQTSEQGASGSPTATCAYDVYCFGKVLLELVTGRLGISASSDAAMKDMLEGILPYISIYDKELVMNILDRSLIIDDDLLEEVWAMAIVARSCLNPKPSRRPLMRYILKALENPLKVVREEHASSARLRTTSSRGSWNAALFGSWRHSSSDVVAIPAAPTNVMEGGSSLKQSRTTGSQESGQNGGGGGDHSSSTTRRQSKEMFPEPSDVQDVVERPNSD
ncbi:probable LRR receptor-like serine/threonine-protein kinase At2g16250 [Cornus florida]|uniref:probable LRR receptor-like serine/threonine-protein kinase At2g16250 n=1 Tax=Cornus florida TaxID=4283 RepID=UPI00289BE83F|nr:probable LRR receptor-like serine/threonine-protein kinase At2g16250 [Cornus florida]